jgi:flagellar biosynthesis/type III secretory pathway protein FliH
MTQSRRLSATALGEEAQSFGQPPIDKTLELDPRLRALLDEETRRAREQGYAEGLREGRTETDGHVERLAAAVALAASETTAKIDEARRATIGGVVALAEAIAEAVIGRTPHDDGQTVLSRTEEALELLEDRPLTIYVCPTEESFVARATAGRDGLVVRADAGLQRGEARIDGTWSHADLTREAAWDRIRQSL